MHEKILEAPHTFLAGLFKKAVNAADPEKIIADHLPEAPEGRVVVVGAGKGAAQMARAFERAWRELRGTRLTGAVVTRYGYGCACQSIEILEASHPVPDEKGLYASERLLEMVSDLTENDLVVALICGGGSSLLPAPPLGFRLDDERYLNEVLLASGLAISQMNTVRKHFSRIKGGRLTVAAHPAKVVSLLVSDIPGDYAHWIASGPTVPDATNQKDAMAIVAQAGLSLPKPIMEHLQSDTAAAPKTGDIHFRNAEHRIIASAKISLEAAARECEKAGLNAVILSDAIEGEARETAKMHAAMAREVAKNERPFNSPVVMLSGGETTVTVSQEGMKSGCGGRNSEFALSFAQEIAGESKIYGLFADTDGIDGSENNAGAFVDGATAGRMGDMEIDPIVQLQANRSYEAFSAIDSLFVTGPTGTNVNDFRAILII